MKSHPVTQIKDEKFEVWFIALAHRQAWCVADCLVYFNSYQEIERARERKRKREKERDLFGDFISHLVHYHVKNDSLFICKPEQLSGTT